jgi:hypothetical protein
MLELRLLVLWKAQRMKEYLISYIAASLVRESYARTILGQVVNPRFS